MLQPGGAQETAKTFQEDALAIDRHHDLQQRFCRPLPEDSLQQTKYLRELVDDAGGGEIRLSQQGSEGSCVAARRLMQRDNNHR